MKLLGNVDFLKSQTAIKFTAFLFMSIAFFYIGKHWSDGSRQLIFFSRQSPSDTTPSLPSIAISPNINKEFNISALINTTEPKPAGSVKNKEKSVSASEAAAPPPPEIKSYGIVDENGTMSDEFEIGEFDPDLVEKWGNATEIEAEMEKEDVRFTFRVKKFGLCEENMREYIPCLDNVEAIKRLKSTERGERFERHCPETGKGLNCLVPAPKGYRPPIPWPRSRNEVWFSNVPHTRLVDDKGGQNWISRKGKDKFKFPGGGTQFIHGADQYLDQISKMVPEITFGHHIRVVLDVGCGVASFGAYLLPQNVITMSIAPKDVHENQIQFALERGVPAMVAAFATRRLLYPSQAFDLIHCS
ncbi:hypothetical protein CRYUN_Cryun05aG0157500 [Craigia yunnanensis]